MYSQNGSIEENVFMYLIYNQQRFKRDLQTYTSQRDTLLKSEDSAFHSDVKKQYDDLIRQILVDNVTKDLAISPEDATMVVENLNVDEYLRV